MYVERMATRQFTALLKHFPAVVVTGARQVGKSTLVAHLLEDRADIVVFDPVVDVENARADPDLFLDNHRTPLVLDEIQYAPELLPSLKRRIDRRRTPGQYVLTGSQQWGVLRSVAESLAGRAAFLDLEGFSLFEVARPRMSIHWLEAWLDSPRSVIDQGIHRLKDDFSVAERLWRGWLPEAHFVPRELVADFHMAYQRTYIERDARLLASVSDWQQFGRFLRLAAALTGQEINRSQLGRDIGVSPQTANRWLDILKATFQWFEVPAFVGNLVKRVSGKAKGYIADTGLACSALAISAPRALPAHPAWGALFETAVFSEVRKAASVLSPRPTIHHWRTAGGAEVDLILERDGVLYPLEVKAASNPSRRDTAGLLAFRKSHPGLRIADGLVIAPCDKLLQLSENDHAMPWDACCRRGS
ncbi:MAG: ATP-binding protein [Candidatus Riflebacteria bacterium]|nr:ATP-binding protein [Candidatus Riflebacteria bacterium]